MSQKFTELGFALLFQDEKKALDTMLEVRSGFKSLHSSPFSAKQDFVEALVDKAMKVEPKSGVSTAILSITYPVNTGLSKIALMAEVEKKFTKTERNFALGRFNRILNIVARFKLNPEKLTPLTASSLLREIIMFYILADFEFCKDHSLTSDIHMPSGGLETLKVIMNIMNYLWELYEESLKKPI